MHPKLIISLQSLESWSQKLLEQGRLKEWQMADFVSGMNITDYQQFYKELIPFVLELKKNDRLLLQGYVNTYLANETVLYEAMQEGPAWPFSLFFSTNAAMRSAEDLLKVINDIRGNAVNIQQQLNLIGDGN